MSTAVVPVVKDARMSLMEHLTELRDRIIKIVAAVVIGMAISFLLYDQIFNFLLEPYVKDCTNSVSDCKLLALDPLEGLRRAHEAGHLRRHLHRHAGDPLAAVALHHAWALRP